jgi:NitT/TauT family transport system substrate-binding protein
MRFVLAVLCVALLAMHPMPSESVDLGQAKLAWSPAPDTPSLAVAFNHNDWTSRGLTVQSVSVPTGREALEAVIGGEVDFAAMAEFPVAVGAMQGKPFHVIAQISRFRGNRVIGTPAMTSLRSLAGRKIGTTLGTNVNYQADVVLQNAGVTTATTINAAPADLVPALARGDIDAAFMFPSFFPLAKKVLGDKYREIRTPDYVTTFLVVASNDVIAQHPDRVRAFLAGLLAANASVVADPVAASTVVSSMMGGVAPPDAIRSLWSEYKFDVSLDQPVLTLLTKEGAWIHDKGLVKGDQPAEALFRSYIDTAPLHQLAPRNVALH